MRLLLVRHGAGESQEGRVIGHADPPLSERGRVEIERLVASTGEPPTRLVTSDLRRARASADIFASRWKLEPVVDPRLRELDFGEWERCTWQELEREDPDRLAHWMRDWVRTPAPGGESFADLVARLSDWLEEWDRTDGPQGTTVVVAHAGSIRATLCRLLGVPLEEAFGFQVDYARVTALSLWGATPTLICRNADRWPDFPPRDDAQQRCPRCGEANECAVAAGKSVSACWCFGARIPRELLADLPEGTRGETCICSRCAAARDSGLPAVHRTIG
ncbi:MAG: cysteine-rich CWC family protein [Gemmatimonadales bacterium]